MRFEAVEVAAAVVLGSGVGGVRGEVMLLLMDWQVSWNCGRCSKRGIEVQSSERNKVGRERGSS